MATKDRADRYEKEYGFMCVNATMQAAKMMYKIHATWMCDELHEIHDELIKRGHKEIATEEEYNAGIAIHGIPPAFKETTTTNEH